MSFSTSNQNINFGIFPQMPQNILLPINTLIRKDKKPTEALEKKKWNKYKNDSLKGLNIYGSDIYFRR